MSNKRITDLTELINPTTDDVFPVVDIATNTTTKVQLGNIPLPTSVINALSTKENTITGAATTITSANLTASRAVISNASGKVAVSSVTDTELGYVSGVTSAIQTQIDAKQATLVSGTNIKTINSTSLLGSGNISIQANPSGVAGAIQFSDGSAFASDATNLFWDNTNKRLGVGFNSPTARLQVRGSGSTSATTSLLVQNSAGTNWLQVKDNGDITNDADGLTDFKFEISPVANKFFRLTRQGVNVDFYAGSGGNSGIIVSGTNTPFNITAASANLTLSNGGVRVGSSYATTNASAQLEIVSTTKGFLPPRMTTTEKNAIASPAAGLVVYDSTTNKLQCYNGSTWNDLF